MSSTLRQWKPGGMMQSTQRADYRPYTEASLQVYQFRCLPKKKPSFHSTPPPKINEETWARYRKYCYRTTNSMYGDSSFTQKGKSLVVSVLEKDPKPVPPEAKKDQGTLSTVNERPSATPPQTECQDTSLLPAKGSKLTAGSSPPATSTTSSTASPPLASASAPTRTSSSAKLSLSPTVKEAWRSDITVAKETAPVAKDTMKATDKLPQIGSGEGAVVQPGEVEDKPELTTYEEFLREARAIDQQQRLLNQRCASLTTYTLRGTPPEYTSYRQSFLSLQQDDNKPIISKLPNPEKKHRHLNFVTEYADKFGFLQRVFPPSTCKNFTPAKVTRPWVAIQHTAAPRRTMCSEYMSSYCHPRAMSRPKTC